MQDAYVAQQSGLLSDTPQGRATGRPGAFDGSLWSLVYEVLCYVLVAALAATGVLRGARHRANPHLGPPDGPSPVGAALPDSESGAPAARVEH